MNNNLLLGIFVVIILYLLFGGKAKTQSAGNMPVGEMYDILGGQGAMPPLDGPNLYGDPGAYNMV